MKAKKNKKKVDTFCEFDHTTFPCKVLAVGQPPRCEVNEGEEYICVDKVNQNLVVLTHDGREVFFNKDWFVLMEEV